MTVPETGAEPAASRPVSVDVLYAFKVLAPNGVAAVIRSLLRSGELFRAQGVVLTVFVPEGRLSTMNRDMPSIKTDGRSWRRGVVRWASRALQWCAVRSYIFSVLSVWVRYLLPSARNASRYGRSSSAPDVLLFHDVFSAHAASRLVERKGLNYVVVIHSVGETFKGLLDYYPRLAGTRFHRWLLSLEADVIARSSAVGLVSESSRQHFIEFHPDVDPAKVKCLPNGLAPRNGARERERDATNQEIRLVSVGSLEAHKGQRTVVEALSQMTVEERKRFRYFVVGDGTLRAELESLAAEVGVRDRVEFLGSRTDVPAILEGMDLFVHMSSNDGLPMAMVEAMRAGLPIISCPVGGIPELVEENVNGWLIDRDPAQLRGLLVRLAGHPGLLLSAGRASAGLFERRFSAKMMVREYTDTLRCVFSWTRMHGSSLSAAIEKGPGEDTDERAWNVPGTDQAGFSPFVKPLIYSVSMYAVQGLNFIVGIVSRNMLGPSLMGNLMVAQSTAQLLNLGHLGIRSHLETEMSLVKEGEEKRRLFRDSFTSAFLTGLIAFGVLLLALTPRFGTGLTRWIWLATLVAFLPYYLFCFFGTAFRAGGHFRELVKIRLGHPISLAVFKLPGVTIWGIWGLLVGQILGDLCGFAMGVFASTRLKYRLLGSVSVWRVTALMKAGSVMYATAIVDVLLQSVDRWFLSWSRGSFEVGQYSASILVSGAMTIGSCAIADYILPSTLQRARTSLREGGKRFSQILASIRSIVWAGIELLALAALASLLVPVVMPHVLPRYAPAIRAMEVACFVGFLSFPIQIVLYCLVSFAPKKVVIVLSASNLLGTSALCALGAGHGALGMTIALLLAKLSYLAAGLVVLDTFVDRGEGPRGDLARAVGHPQNAVRSGAEPSEVPAEGAGERARGEDQCGKDAEIVHPNIGASFLENRIKQARRACNSWRGQLESTFAPGGLYTCPARKLLPGFKEWIRALTSRHPTLTTERTVAEIDLVLG